MRDQVSKDLYGEDGEGEGLKIDLVGGRPGPGSTQEEMRRLRAGMGGYKNPRNVTFAKQVNNATGPRQVNNGTAASNQAETGPARTEETGSAPNNLFEVQYAEWVDAGKAGATTRGNPDVAALAKRDGTSDRPRKGSRGPKRTEGRRAVVDA